MPEKKIPVSDAKVGMVLARPLQDDQGRTLMGEGSRLTPAAVKRLGKWGIPEIFVHEGDAPAPSSGESEAESKPDSPKIDEAYMRKTAEAINLRFHEVSDNPLMESLKKMAFKRLVLSGPKSIPGTD